MITLEYNHNDVKIHFTIYLPYPNYNQHTKQICNLPQMHEKDAIHFLKELFFGVNMFYSNNYKKV